MEKKIIILISFITLLTIYCYAQVEVKKEYYPDRQLKSETPYKNGEKERVEKLYYPDGKLKQEIPYKKGVRNGIVKVYFENGQLFLEGSIKEGKRNGVTKEFDKNGNLVKEEFYVDGILQINLAELPKPTKLEFDIYKHLTTAFWSYPDFLDNEAWNKIVQDTAQQFSLTEEEVNDIYERCSTFQKAIPDVKIEEISYDEFEKRITNSVSY